MYFPEGLEDAPFIIFLNLIFFNDLEEAEDDHQTGIFQNTNEKFDKFLPYNLKSGQKIRLITL